MLFDSEINAMSLRILLLSYVTIQIQQKPQGNLTFHCLFVLSCIESY